MKRSMAGVAGLKVSSVRIPNEDSGRTATLKLQFLDGPTPRWEGVETRLEAILEED